MANARPAAPAARAKLSRTHVFHKGHADGKALDDAIRAGNVHSHDAYGSLSVVSALVFSFSATDLSNHLSSSDYVVHEHGARPVALLLLALAVGCSALSLVIMTQQYYQVSILLERFPRRLVGFTHETFKFRQIARFCLWTSLTCFIVSIAVFAVISNRVPRGTGAALFAVLSSAAAVVLAVQRLLNRAFIRAKRKGAADGGEDDHAAASPVAVEQDHSSV